MPNHIKNKLSVIGKQGRICDLFDFIKSDTSELDFDNIVPMPQTYKDFDTTNHPMGRGIKDEALKQQYVQATNEQRDQYGVVGWYDWCLKNWGTKWNAYDIERNGTEIEWSTAWSGVPELMQKLVDMFPDLEFEYMYADEDAGYNVGYGQTNGDGILSMTYPDGGSDEAYSVYLELNCWAEHCLKKVDGEWQWIDEY